MVQVSKQAVKTLVVFSIFMFTLPILVFYGTRNFLLVHYGREFQNLDVLAALAALVMVQILLGTFAVIAWKDECSEDDEYYSMNENKQDESNLTPVEKSNLMKEKLIQQLKKKKNDAAVESPSDSVNPISSDDIHKDKVDRSNGLRNRKKGERKTEADDNDEKNDDYVFVETMASKEN